MSELYEANFKLVSKYVHATSRGHEAIQIATGMQLTPDDYVYPYYRDDALLLSVGMQPYDLMLQLLAKRDDPFSGGRTYYSHPSLRDSDKPKIPHQSSATGMQAIPATGAALGLQYRAQLNIETAENAVVVCSLGDASVTEGEVAEAFQMAALRQLPILYLVQDNGWDISASADEVRAQNAYEYSKGFHGITAFKVNGSSFADCHQTLAKALKIVREERKPVLVHAEVPLLNHHTSGVRMEWYRDDLEEAKAKDPYPIIINQLIDAGVSKATIDEIENTALEKVQRDFERALKAEDPQPADLFTHDFANTPVLEEQGERAPDKGQAVVMVDCALHAVEELMSQHPECLLYGQDV
ncbi:MAG: thiamine pyrophosphate-dependent dehydrogenase E1 component subunit alpha, partial [Bacteroidota bacterium]